MLVTFKWRGLEDVVNIFYGIDAHTTDSPKERHKGQLETSAATTTKKV